MSIHNLSNKIKSKSGIDRYTIMYLCIVVLVALASFGLGIISRKEVKEDESIQIVSQEVKGASVSRNYVASKNGKLYYPLSCKGASRIKEENRMYFESSSEAQSLGYSYATTCK